MGILGIVSRTHDSGSALLERGVPTVILEEESKPRWVTATKRLNQPLSASKIAFSAYRKTKIFDSLGIDLAIKRALVGTTAIGTKQTNLRRSRVDRRKQESAVYLPANLS